MPTYPLTLPVGSILRINGNELSEHNREPVNISVTRLEKIQRMSNGTLRKFFIADKKNISISWTMLPSYSTFTVDGKWGARDIKSFYESATGQASFPVTVKYGTTQNAEDLVMVFSSCSFDVVRRNVKTKISDTPQEFWNVSLTLEEV